MFVDIHNHILPGVDDGASNIAEALQMARLAVASGTDTLVATPHRGWFLHHPARPEVIREHVASLQESLNRAQIPLTVLPGVEIKMGPRVAADLVNGELSTLGEAGQWVLIEPPFDTIPASGLDSLKRVLDAGFRIVLAHPERCAAIQASLTFLESCAEIGLAFQLTSGSLLGTFGPKAQSTAESILTHAADWPLVIASDTHDLYDRPPNLLAEARDAAAFIVGAHEAQNMVDARPRAMITP
ncbi:MAG: tyrosine-protein phosphatase [Janthinobacterium lividum]